MKAPPLKVKDKLIEIIQNSNIEYAKDKVDTFINLYFLCRNGHEIWKMLKLTAIWRFVTDCPELLHRETLGEDKYNTIMNMYNEAIQKFS